MKLTLKSARVNKGLTQEDAAKLIGVSTATLRSYERGDSYPTVPVIVKIEEAYGVHYGDLVFLPEATV